MPEELELVLDVELLDVLELALLVDEDEELLVEDELEELESSRSDFDPPQAVRLARVRLSKA